MHSRSTLLSIFSSLNTSPSSDVCIFSTTFSGSEDSFTRFLDLMWKSDLFYFLTPSCLPMEPLGGLEGKHKKVAKAEISSVSHYWSTKKSRNYYLTPDALSIEYLAANGQVSSATFSHEGKVFCDAITRAVCLIWSIGRSKTEFIRWWFRPLSGKVAE